MSEVRIYGIRHHGPGPARSLLRALDSFVPDTTLVEGLADADATVSHVVGLKPPVALLAWVIGEPSRAAFWPFATFSPEWQVLDWAVRNSRAASFTSFPGSLGLVRSREERMVESDPLGPLAGATGYDDPERWWEDPVEQRDENVSDVIAEAMAAVREDGGDDEETLLREIHMCKALRTTKYAHEKIAVVCGVYHAPALTAKAKVADDNVLLKQLPKVKTQLTWVPWSHDRPAASSGYEVGARSPGRYHHLFATPDRPVERRLTHVGAVLREHDLPTSSTRVIEGIRLADALVMLRGHPVSGLSEVQEATLAMLCGGSDLVLDLVTQEAIVDELLGEVPDDVPRTPFDTDLTAIVRRLRLKQGATEKEFDLDLYKESGSVRSYFPRRLRILGIDWGIPVGSSGTGTFKETWRLLWEPELSIAVVGVSRWSNTVEAVVAARLLDNVGDLARMTRGVNRASAADLPTAMPELLRLPDVRAAAETDTAWPLEAFSDSVQAYRYGGVRGTDTGRLGGVVTALLGRACAGFPVALGGSAPEVADRYRRLIDKANAAIGLLGEQAQQPWWNTLLVAVDRHDLPGPLVGRPVRLLFDGGDLGVDEAQQRLSLALSGGHVPGEQAAWVEGVLPGNSLLLLHSPALLKTFDTWVMGPSDESFTDVFPVVRRAFGGWKWSKRQALAGKVANLDRACPVAEEELNLTEFATVLAAVDEILESAR